MEKSFFIFSIPNSRPHTGMESISAFSDIFFHQNSAFFISFINHVDLSSLFFLPRMEKRQEVETDFSNF
jgi:hypothetical protein